MYYFGCGRNMYTRICCLLADLPHAVTPRQTVTQQKGVRRQGGEALRMLRVQLPNTGKSRDDAGGVILGCRIWGRLRHLIGLCLVAVPSTPSAAPSVTPSVVPVTGSSAITTPLRHSSSSASCSSTPCRSNCRDVLRLLFNQRHKLGFLEVVSAPHLKIPAGVPHTKGQWGTSGVRARPRARRH